MILWLVIWLVVSTPLKHMKVSWNISIPNIWKNQIHVRNHQQVIRILRLLIYPTIIPIPVPPKSQIRTSTAPPAAAPPPPSPTPSERFWEGHGGHGAPGISLFWWSQKWMASWLTSFDPEQLGVEPHFLSCKSGFDIWFYRHTIHQKQVFDHEEFDLAQNIWFALLQPSFTTHHKSRLRYQKQQKPDPWSAGLNMIRNWATSLYINLCYIITWEKTTHTHIYIYIISYITATYHDHGSWGIARGHFRVSTSNTLCWFWVGFVMLC